MIEFFADGVVPTGHKVEFFLNSVAKLEPRDEIILAKAIAGLSPSKLKDLSQRILPVSKDDRLLKLFFKNPGVHRKMDGGSLTNYFVIIRSMEFRGDITRDLFEDLASSLVAGYSSQYGDSFLARLSFANIIATDGSNTAEKFKSPDFDLALSRHLSSYEIAKQNSSQCMRSAEALKGIELPATLEVYLRAMQAVKPDYASQIVADMIMLDRLPSSYIDVARLVLGDELFIQVANNSKHNLRGIRSIANLAPVLGEVEFHTPEFLEELEDQLANGEIPDYLIKFHEMGFDDVRLPILADFLVEHMNIAITFDPDQKDMKFSADLVGLATRRGFGADALKISLKAMAPTFGSSPDDPVVDVLNAAFGHSTSRAKTFIRIQAYSHLLNILSKVGLETLRELAPSVRDGLVLDVIGKRSIQISKKEVMKMFPQTKGAILEIDLGL